MHFSRPLGLINQLLLRVLFLKSIYAALNTICLRQCRFLNETLRTNLRTFLSRYWRMRPKANASVHLTLQYSMFNNGSLAPCSDRLVLCVPQWFPLILHPSAPDLSLHLKWSPPAAAPAWVCAEGPALPAFACVWHNLSLYLFGASGQVPITECHLLVPGFGPRGTVGKQRKTRALITHACLHPFH